MGVTANVPFGLLASLVILFVTLAAISLVSSMVADEGEGLGHVAIGILFVFAAYFTNDVLDSRFHANIAEARSISICRETLEQALTEYRSDFGTAAVEKLSESDELVPVLAKEYQKDGKTVGPYIYEETVIEQCAARKWRIRPVTATTLHVDVVKEEEK